MFAKLKPMVTPENYNSIVREPLLFQFGQQATYKCIHVTHAGVIATQQLTLLGLGN